MANKTVTADGFKCEDVRVLREALSFCARSAIDKTAKSRALVGLKSFSLRVAPYCTHTEKTPQGQCLWCGALER
jgi:hypothetical protein